MTSDINKQSPKTCDDVTDVKASNSNVEATKEPSGTTLDKTPPHKSSSTNLLKNVQNTKLLSSSIASHSTESVYTDAVSHASDDYASCDEPILVTSLQDSTTVPISSSLIDTLSGINRLINVVRHFAQVLCPDRSTTRYDSLRMSPDGRNEMQDKLEQGRVNMARKLRDVCNLICHNLFYACFSFGRKYRDEVTLALCDLFKSLYLHTVIRGIRFSIKLTDSNLPDGPIPDFVLRLLRHRLRKLRYERRSPGTYHWSALLDQVTQPYSGEWRQAVSSSYGWSGEMQCRRFTR